MNQTKYYFIKILMMMIAHNSRACKGGKERGDVKGEHGGI